MKRMAALLALAMFGCGHSVSYTALNAPPHPLAPRAPASVELFMTAKPSRPSIAVGFFEIEQQSPASGGTPEMMSELRKRAGAVGCDALVITESTDRIQSYSGQSFGTVQTTAGAPGTMGTYQGTTTGTANHVRGHHAVCIVYSDATAPVTDAPATSTPSEAAPVQQL